MSAVNRWLVASIVLVSLTVVGFAISLRIEQTGGSFYGAGSSHRADQEGTRILYESLKAYPGITVQQNAERWERAVKDLDPPTTLVLQLNAPRYMMMEDDTLVEFLEAGGRVLHTPPRLVGGLGESVFEEIEAQEEEERRKSKEKEDAEEKARKWLGWNQLDLERVPEPEIFPLTPLQPDSPDAPPEVDIKLRQYFMNTEGWEVVAEANDQPVLLRKTRGEGELLLLADEGLLVNGRMFANPPTDWIVWALGDSTHVVFQEGHLGMGNPQSLTALMWQYNIGALLPALAIPFLLLVWRACLPFLPTLPMEEEPEQGPQGRVEGTRDFFARYIGPKHILTECLNRWGSQFHSEPADSPRTKALDEGRELLASLPSKEATDLPKTYARLDKLLNQKRKRT